MSESRMAQIAFSSSSERASVFCKLGTVALGELMDSDGAQEVIRE